MPAYRLYRLDGADKIKSAEWVEAMDDEDAIASAREKLGQTGFELWQQNRLVFSAPDQPA